MVCPPVELKRHKCGQPVLQCKQARIVSRVQGSLMTKVLASPALLLSLLFFCMSGAMADTIPRNVVAALAPTGHLPAAINFGNVVLAQKDAASGEPRGVSA